MYRLAVCRRQFASDFGYNPADDCYQQTGLCHHPLPPLLPTPRYDWLLTCPGPTIKSFTGVAPPITAGPSANASIDTTGLTGAVSCSLALSVTDALGRSVSNTTTVIVFPAGSAGGPVADAGGPYTANVSTTVVNVSVTGAASQCPTGNCT